MRRWGILVVFLYGLILTVLFFPLIMLSELHFHPGDEGIFIGLPSNPAQWTDLISRTWSSYCGLINSIYWWICLGVAIIAQAALLTVPVERAAQRPSTRRSVIPLIITASFTMAILIIGFVISMSEVISQENTYFYLQDSVPLLVRLLPLVIFLLVWLFWAFIFFKLNKKTDTNSLIQHLCGLFLKGSILELLVAVPAYIYVKQRDNCCAGLMTFVGIAFGVAVMLFSFGPGIYFLFVNYCKKISKK